MIFINTFPVFILIGRKSAQQGLGTSTLPTFSAQEKSYIKGTLDFPGIGHFTTRYAIQKSSPFLQGSNYNTDRDLAELADPKWPAPGSEWLYLCPGDSQDYSTSLRWFQSKIKWMESLVTCRSSTFTMRTDFQHLHLYISSSSTGDDFIYVNQSTNVFVCRRSTGTLSFTWQRTEFLRRCSVLSCAMNGE